MDTKINTDTNKDTNTDTEREIFLHKVYYMRRRPWMILSKSIILLAIMWVFLLPYWGKIRPEFFLFIYCFIILAFFLYALWGQWTFLCIKCSNRFFFPPHLFYNPFAKTCQHCDYDPSS
ncbi:MAG: hypothetical protein HQK51_18335 [Oligoflexia bacterium]|nr:hypothetical protein [Oligoflexia bacterium]